MNKASIYIDYNADVLILLFESLCIIIYKLEIKELK